MSVTDNNIEYEYYDLNGRVNKTPEAVKATCKETGIEIRIHVSIFPQRNRKIAEKLIKKARQYIKD